MTEWSELVKSTFKAGRQQNQSYQLKDAMQDAKAVYKQGGSGSCGLAKGGEAKLEGGNPLKMNMGGKKKKRTLKKQKKSKKGKKSRRH